MGGPYISTSYIIEQLFQGFSLSPLHQFDFTDGTSAVECAILLHALYMIGWLSAK